MKIRFVCGYWGLIKGLMGIEHLLHVGRSFCSVFLLYPGVEGGAVVRALASH